MIFVSQLKVSEKPYPFADIKFYSWAKMVSNGGNIELKQMADLIGIPTEQFDNPDVREDDDIEFVMLGKYGEELKYGDSSYFLLSEEEHAKALVLGAIELDDYGLFTVIHRPKSKECDYIFNKYIRKLDLRREVTHPHLQWHFDIEYHKNLHIRKWWSEDHDALLSSLITTMRWWWFHEVSNKIVEMTPADTIVKWKSTDPIPQQYAWNNVLMFFAAARANEIGLLEQLSEPVWRVCPVCFHRFREDSVRYTFVQRLGVNQVDICEPCLDRIVFGRYDGEASANEVIAYLQDLTVALGHPPTQGWGMGINDFRYMDTEKRAEVLMIRERKPSVEVVKLHFGTWKNALIEAGVLGIGKKEPASSMK